MGADRIDAHRRWGRRGLRRLRFKIWDAGRNRCDRFRGPVSTHRLRALSCRRCGDSGGQASGHRFRRHDRRGGRRRLRRPATDRAPVPAALDAYQTDDQAHHEDGQQFVGGIHHRQLERSAFKRIMYVNPCGSEAEPQPKRRRQAVL